MRNGIIGAYRVAPGGARTLFSFPDSLVTAYIEVMFSVHLHALHAVHGSGAG